MTIMDKLAMHFPPAVVSWRLGATKADDKRGQAFAYIDARDVMQRLDTVLGADWQCTYTPMADGSFCCNIGIKIDGEWRWRANGAVNVSDSTKSDAQEMATKGGYSDAFKRAAVAWGVGRYLYELPTPWVDIVPAGRSWKIANHEKSTLLNILSRAAKQYSQSPPVQDAREPELEAPEPETPPAAEEKSSRPSYVTQPATRDPKTKAAEEAARRAQDAQERMAHSEIIRKGWIADLGRYHAELKDGGRAPHLINIDFQAWEQTRLAQWSKLVPHDRAIISRAISKVQSEMAAAKAKVAA